MTVSSCATFLLRFFRLEGEVKESVGSARKPGIADVVAKYSDGFIGEEDTRRSMKEEKQERGEGGGKRHDR